MEGIELSPDEELVYSILKKKCRRICKEYTLSDRLRESIKAVCDIIALTPDLADSDIEPEKAALIMHLLIQKGFVRLIPAGDTSISFVPLGYWEYKETTIGYKPI